MRGGLSGGRRWVDTAAQNYPSSLTWWALKGWIDSSEGDLDAVRTLLDERSTEELAAEDPSYLWRITVVGAAVSAAAVGDRRWAQAVHETLTPYTGRNVVLGYAAYLGAADHHLGVLESVLGRADDAVGHLDAAIERHRTIGARPWTALSQAWLANVLSERDAPGDADRAAALHAESVATAADLGLVILPPAHTKLVT
jgi:hypothetical protein